MRRIPKPEEIESLKDIPFPCPACHMIVMLKNKPEPGQKKHIVQLIHIEPIHLLFLCPSCGLEGTYYLYYETRNKAGRPRLCHGFKFPELAVQQEKYIYRDDKPQHKP
jgi:predicted RNA-binding Zn-ribbon protein involved in translation (DUF1610 family)